MLDIEEEHAWRKPSTGPPAACMAGAAAEGSADAVRRRLRPPDCSSPRSSGTAGTAAGSTVVVRSAGKTTRPGSVADRSDGCAAAVDAVADGLRLE